MEEGISIRLIPGWNAEDSVLIDSESPVRYDISGWLIPFEAMTLEEFRLRYPSKPIYRPPE